MKFLDVAMVDLTSDKGSGCRSRGERLKANKRSFEADRGRCACDGDDDCRQRRGEVLAHTPASFRLKLFPFTSVTLRVLTPPEGGCVFGRGGSMMVAIAPIVATKP
jgi:hypothetical protein